MKRPRDAQEIIEETVDGEIMEWDLQDLCWESSTDHLELDPRQDHHDHDDHNLVQLDFTNSTLTPPPKSTSQTSEANNNNATPPASGGPPKRAIRAQKMSCLVDGCNADLSGCRDYHRRHRVCERHSKAPTVSVKGEEKRFCQQCSRFHSLGEFDEVKRSCRKRLDGHNRRRRKSQPEPLYFSSKSFLSGYKGPRILHFGNPQICATASVRTLWPVETKTEPEPWLHSSPHKRFQATRQPSPQTCLGGKVNNYYQQSSAEQFLCYPFEPPQAGRGRNNEHHRAMVSSLSFDEEISLPIDSGGRALYLLSTNPTPQPSESCSVQLLDYDPKDKAVPDYPFPTSYYNIANKTIIDNDVSDVGVYALRMGPDSLLEHGALQMLPISLE